jgi:uncharacterized glyoxalase superfamily protein PhnB
MDLLANILGSGVQELLGASSAIYLLQKDAGSAPWDGSPAGQARRYERHWTPVHLDFVVSDAAAAVDRAVAAGARLEQPIEALAFGRFAVLADPFGNGFCLIEFLGSGYDELSP